MGVTLDQGLRSAELASNRFTRLLRSGPDPQQQVVGLTWTVQQLGAHLASSATAYREVIEGAPTPYLTVEDRVATNQQRLAPYASMELKAQADHIDAEMNRLLVPLRSRGDDGVISWLGGIGLPATAFAGTMIGEFTFHGLDLARTAGVHWKIECNEIFAVVDFFNVATPHFVDHDAAKGVEATFEVRYRGYDTATFAFRDGNLAVTPGAASRADVRMSVDPIWFLEICYGRTGLAKGVVTGRTVAWGRRPWLALKFASYFESP
jgi:hypothetical protein